MFFGNMRTHLLVLALMTAPNIGTFRNITTDSRMGSKFIQ